MIVDCSGEMLQLKTDDDSICTGLDLGWTLIYASRSTPDISYSPKEKELVGDGIDNNIKEILDAVIQLNDLVILIYNSFKAQYVFFDANRQSH